MSEGFSTKGKVVAITGGGSGIGLSYAQLAHEHGAKGILIGDLRLTEEAQRFVDAHDNVVFQECDVIKWAELQGIIDAAKAAFGEIPDVFIASAGLFEPPYSNFWADPEPLDANGYASVDVNVNHPIKLTRLAIRALLGAGKKGIVVLVASIAGYSKQYCAPIYSATKHAVVGFTRSMGDTEQLQHVKVVCVCPGIVSTPIWTVGHPGAAERFGVTPAISIGAEKVAEVIEDAVQSSKYPGGTIIEVSALGTRVIPEWHIDPPGMIDGKMAEGTDVPPEMIQRALEPILAVTAAEKSTTASA
ncbi:NAD(P)-binding protein [Thozetella sp. PMI_491]|nr:NAD(P)-binding protein [Thozetella sp. PMI_491]